MHKVNLVQRSSSVLTHNTTLLVLLRVLKSYCKLTPTYIHVYETCHMLHADYNFLYNNFSHEHNTAWGYLKHITIIAFYPIFSLSLRMIHLQYSQKTSLFVIRIQYIHILYVNIHNQACENYVPNFIIILFQISLKISSLCSILFFLCF